MTAAQISSDIIDKYRADLQKQTVDEDQKREGGTQPRDWNYDLVKGKLFLPPGFAASSKSAAVVLALTFDYRGWGQSGAFIYTAEPIRWDDRLRFSQHTAKVRLRRKRPVPDAQVTVIRNAITFVQGEAGVDRARIGVWGADLGGGHAITVAASDARLKAVVAQVPVIAGHGTKRTAYVPTAPEQAEMVLMLDLIPQSVSTLFVVAEKDTVVDNERNAIAASKVLKGTTEVKTIPGATHAMTGAAADAAADAAAAWFAKHL